MKINTAAFQRGYDRGQLRLHLRKQGRMTQTAKRMLEHRIEGALTARRTAKNPAITDDDMERIFLEWSIIREELEKDK